MLLKDLSAEIVIGDYDVPPSLGAAFSRADAVFCNTDF
jgi:NmrA-like family